MRQRRRTSRQEVSGILLGRIRREARASLERLHREGQVRIRAIDRQIAKLGAQQQALLGELQSTLEAIRRAANAPWLDQGELSRSGRGRASATGKRGGRPSRQHLRLVGGPQWRVAPETVTLREMERDHIAAVLVTCGWNQSLAAVRLGIGRNTLMRKVKTFGLRKTPQAA